MEKFQPSPELQAPSGPFIMSRSLRPAIQQIQLAKTNKVEVDATVLLCLTKACADAYPSQASGQILGFETNELLSVSRSFAFPASASDGNEGLGLRSKLGAKYQSDLIEHLKEVNIDANTVGWYLGCGASGKVFTTAVIETMLAYYNENPESVLLVHDTKKSLSTHTISLEAYRLSTHFLEARKSNNFSSKFLSEHKLHYSNVVERVPVELKNSHLATLFLHSSNLAPSIEDESRHTLGKSGLDRTVAPTFDNLGLSIGEILEKSMEGIFDSIEDFSYELSNYNYYQRQLARDKAKIQQWQQRRKIDNSSRATKGEPPLSLDDWQSQFTLPEKPSRLENLLISAQMDLHCRQIEQIGAVSSAKLFNIQKNLTI